ncbi:biofilm development regulator YmgB/AriR family protein [Serratia odorifera]|uniref:Biofilm development protein YmgB/AriR n=2 Tax=Serratia odorifera TaxID=618 RepID=D4E8W2_SEROD|nr:biofilm development regulator YmgB/AriR family protein [Serratia odorifera]EFE93728.1 hypothetical protein HMPREF0758_4612 [Serratia odorifera DSM 4582]MBJ2064084.1 hypothetical protein [Serratia odorifera]PNK88654.1 hypothetical protein CEQ31_002565 [Serratia odorifera]RII69551.1 hypothetical protein DX901_23700 [Serratia odorifera]VDZ65270.1 Biofilm development protein YmgB/AriR [Serratia odorifera]
MRHSIRQTAKEISEYFNTSDAETRQHAPTLTALVSEMVQDGQPVSNKTLVARLVHKLELESDERQLHNYRLVLEHLLIKNADAAGQ